MKFLLFILSIGLFVSCKREVPLDECLDKVVWIRNAGELHTILAKAAAPVPQDWAIRCQVLNDGVVETHQIVIRKGEKTGYVEFQSTYGVKTFQVRYCGPLDN